MSQKRLQASLTVRPQSPTHSLTQSLQNVSLQMDFFNFCFSSSPLTLSSHKTSQHSMDCGFALIKLLFITFLFSPRQAANTSPPAKIDPGPKNRTTKMPIIVQQDPTNSFSYSFLPMPLAVAWVFMGLNCVILLGTENIMGGRGMGPSLSM